MYFPSGTNQLLLLVTFISGISVTALIATSDRVSNSIEADVNTDSERLREKKKNPGMGKKYDSVYVIGLKIYKETKIQIGIRRLCRVPENNAKMCVLLETRNIRMHILLKKTILKTKMKHKFHKILNIWRASPEYMY